MSLLSGKKALILGLANNRSIAWGIAQSLKEQGAQLACTYMNEAMKKRVEPLAEEISADFIHEMDVTQDDHYPSLCQKIEEKWGHFDILVHSLAFADSKDLKGRFLETDRHGFQLALDISAYSLIALCRHLRPLLNENASIMAMTYHGSQQVIPNYNVMGVAKAALEASVRYLATDLGQESIRVNCLSAGPIKTLAASGISGFRTMLNDVAEKAPLKRNISIEDVGGLATYLASDLSRNVTGQTLYVDSGLSILGA